MTILEDLHDNSNTKAFARGVAIAKKEKNLYTKQASYEGNKTIIESFVASSSGWKDRYRTQVVLNEISDEVIEYSCTCPAFREYAGLCKHCIALALSFVAAPEKFVGYKPNRASESSPAVMNFLQRTQSTESENVEPKSVHLSTEFTYDYGNWDVSFRIQYDFGQSYVIKNIEDFLNLVRNNDYFEYGKKLALMHNYAMFDDESLKIVRFLENAVAFRSETFSNAYSRFYLGGPKIERSISLTTLEVIQLFEILENSTFSIKANDYKSTEIKNACIKNENPPLKIEFLKARGGWNLQMNEQPCTINQGGKMYMWLGGKEVYKCTQELAACATFLESVFAYGEGIPFVSEKDMPEFCAAALPLIENPLNLDAPKAIDKYRKVPCNLRFYFDKNRWSIILNAEAAYNEYTYAVFGEVQNTSITAKGSRKQRQEMLSLAPARDKQHEARATQLIQHFFNQGTNKLSLKNDEAVADLVFGGLEKFRKMGEVYTTPSFDKIMKEEKPKYSIGVSLSGSLINLDVSSDDLSAKDLATLLSAYRQKKRYHRLAKGGFVNLEEYDLSQLDHLASDLDLSISDITSGQMQVPKYRAFYLDAQKELDYDAGFKKYVDNFKKVNEKSYKVPKALAGTLRNYQKYGYGWLAARTDAGFGGILADEMGLGKSIQLITLIMSKQEEAQSPSLIICPSSLVYNWKAEFERFAPNLNVKTVNGAAELREEIIYSACEGWDDDFVRKPVNVLITSYDMARIDNEIYLDCDFYIIALDEAQYIKNPATQTTRAVKKIPGEHRFALTGTPIENRLSELWSIFDFLMPGILGSYSAFRGRFEIPIVGGDEEAQQRLQKIVGPFILRRQKADVLKDLPDKLETVVYAPIEGQQKRLYSAHEQNLRMQLTKQKKEKGKRAAARAAGENVSSVEVLAELTKLRQLCCDPRLLYSDYKHAGTKIQTIAEIINSTIEAEEKVLVFSQFTSFLELIATHLDDEKIKYYTITGKTNKKKRLDLVNAFNEDDVPVFLISLKAGGTGLNLTGASVVIHADPWWNAAAQQQATDRAHRIGQTRVVSVQKVIAKGTIEERILKLQEEKSKLATQIVNAGGISLANLSSQDLIDLLSD